MADGYEFSFTNLNFWTGFDIVMIQVAWLLWLEGVINYFFSDDVYFHSNQKKIKE